MKKSNNIKNIIRKQVRTVLNEKDNLHSLDDTSIWIDADEFHSEINRSLDKAKQYWRAKLNHPVIGLRFQKQHGKSKSEWNKIKKGYLNIINLAHVDQMKSYHINDKTYVGFYNVGKRIGYKSDLFRLNDGKGSSFVARVWSRGGRQLMPASKSDLRIEVFVKVKKVTDALDLGYENIGRAVEFEHKAYNGMAEVMVHEIQHLLYYYYPLSPPKRIQQAFPGGDTGKTGASGKIISSVFYTKDVKRLAKLTEELYSPNTGKLFTDIQKTLKKFLKDKKTKENPRVPQVYTDVQEWRVLYAKHGNKFTSKIKEMKAFDELIGYTKGPLTTKGYYFIRLCNWIMRVQKNGECDYACDQNEKLSDIEAARYIKYEKTGKIADNYIDPKEYSKAFHTRRGQMYQEIKCWACNGFQPNLWDVWTNLNQLVKNKVTGDELGDKTQTMA